MTVVAAHTTPRTAARDALTARLAAEFLDVPTEIVSGRVRDAWARTEHLGITATPEVIERIAREHLLAVVNSTPPPKAPR